MENKKSKQELLECAQKLADKHAELKLVIEDMLKEMDAIEMEYIKVLEEIKKS